ARAAFTEIASRLTHSCASSSTGPRCSSITAVVGGFTLRSAAPAPKVAASHTNPASATVPASLRNSDRLDFLDLLRQTSSALGSAFVRESNRRFFLPLSRPGHRIRARRHRREIADDE